MPAHAESKAVALSQKLFERLLTAYPKTHREKYGPEMAQVFRDQCRDVWREANSRGLVMLWLRVLPDLVKTSFLEHLAAMKGKKSMADKISEVTGPGSAPLRTFLGVAAVVFLVVFGVTALVTSLLPESFASTARIKVERDASPSTGQNASPGTASGYDPYFIQTEFEVIQSEVVLSKVIESLDLNNEWGKRYTGGSGKLKTWESLQLLKARLELRPVRNSSLIEIRAFSERPDEAAKIANTTAEVYREHRLQRRLNEASGVFKALKEQYEEQEARVRNAERAVDALRKECNISAADAAGNSPASSSEAEVVSRLNGERVTFETMLTKDETMLRELARLSPEQRRDALQTLIGPDDVLNKLLAELNSAELALVGIQNDFAPTHPNYLKARAVADAARKRVNERVEGVMVGLSNRVSGLKVTVGSLQKKIEEARADTLDKAVRSRPYYEAKARLEELERFRSVLDRKLATERMDFQMPKSLAEIMDRAVPGVRPVRPNKPLNLFLGACGGILLALLVGGGAALVVSLIRKKARGQAAAA